MNFRPLEADKRSDLFRIFQLGFLLMKKFTVFPLLALSSIVSAESTVSNVAGGAALAPSAQVISPTDPVLPQLSLEAQQARKLELEKLTQEDAIRDEQLAEAKARIAKEVGKPLFLATEVAKIYFDNDFSLLWQDKKAEKAFLKEYALFAVSGVSPKSARALQYLLETEEGLARDILLTDSFLDYLYYNRNVEKFANQWLYNLGSYKTKSPSSEQIENWVSSVKNGEAAQFISDLVPRNHVYQETVQKLLTMSPMESMGTKKSTKGKKSKNSEKNTQNNAKSAVSFAKLALNAQRLRIIPSFNNGIFVNIPSYQLYYFRDGKQILQSKVIVGRDDRKTPVMYSKLSNVVVNPPWNVPASIKNKDLVPKMRKDPSYVERRGYEIIDNKGNKVNPHSINWEAYDNPNKNFPYHIRQKAGDDSALGRYKFNMPSSDAIFLHDTPNRGLFGKSDRALSSGCVRVAKSDELATLLLKEAGWSDQRKQNVLSSKKTTSAPIRSDNPVYLYYVTAWVENGTAHTLPDIYKFDRNIPKVDLDWTKVQNLF